MTISHIFSYHDTCDMYIWRLSQTNTSCNECKANMITFRHHKKTAAPPSPSRGHRLTSLPLPFANGFTDLCHAHFRMLRTTSPNISRQTTSLINTHFEQHGRPLSPATPTGVTNSSCHDDKADNVCSWCGDNPVDSLMKGDV